MDTSNNWNQKLRLTLRANATFSLTSATIFLYAPISISRLIGFPSHTIWVQAVGAGLLLFGAYLFFLTRNAKNPLKSSDVYAIIAGDSLWVVSSIVWISFSETSLTRDGIILISIIAIIVELFASLQTYFLIRRNKSLSPHSTTKSSLPS